VVHFLLELYTTFAGGVLSNPINSTVIQANNVGTSPYASFYIKFNVTEPLLFLSPYISGHSNSQSALVGVSNMLLTLNIGSANRVWSNASYGNLNGVADPVPITPTISNVSLMAFTNTALLMCFLTIPPTLYDKVARINICNYNQYTPYQTTFTSNLASKASLSYSTITSTNKTNYICTSTRRNINNLRFQLVLKH